jgi:hypothetical protein
MPETLTNDGKYTEEFIERIFGVTVSKLRTAQRLQFVRSDVALNSERRIIRVWHIKDVAKVWLANQSSHYFSIPFLAAVGSIKTYESIAGLDVGELLADKSPDETSFPQAHLYDREVLTAGDTNTVGEFALGRLECDIQGRTQFVEDRKAVWPAERDWTSRTTIDLQMLRSRMLEIVSGLP